MKIPKKSLLPSVIIILLFLLIYLIGTKVPEDTIRYFVKSAGPYGILIITLLLLLTNIIAPLSGSPILFIGFYLYGQKIIFLAYIAAVISSVTNFLIARLWGKPMVIKLIGIEALKKIDKYTKNYGMETLIIFRLFLKEFHDVISYAFGLSNIKFTPYILISVFGMIPATIAWYIISINVHSALIFTAISWIFAYVSLSGYFLLKWLFKKIINVQKRNT